MSVPTLDRPRTAPAGRPRRRARLVVAASALVAVAIAVGVSLAIATRPIDRQAPAAAGAATDQGAATSPRPTGQPEQGSTADPGGPAPSKGPGPAGGDSAALDDGDHDAYITRIDRARSRIVVDVVQVFHDDEAVEAAIADGKPPADAKYLTTWVRNQNPRLRTLPLAGDLEVRLRDACGEPDQAREALLDRLAANARQGRIYYYTLTVDDGSVRRIRERLAVNAC